MLVYAICDALAHIIAFDSEQDKWVWIRDEWIDDISEIGSTTASMWLGTGQLGDHVKYPGAALIINGKVSHVDYGICFNKKTYEIGETVDFTTLS